MDPEYYKVLICMVTGGECDSWADCQICTIGKRKYKQEQEEIEQQRIEDTTSFNREVSFYGEMVKGNQAKTMAVTDEITLNKLFDQVPGISTTPHVYGNYVKKYYPDFELVKETLDLGKPIEILRDHEKVGVFKYTDCVYLCAPMLELVE